MKKTKKEIQEKVPFLAKILQVWLYMSYIGLSYLFYMHVEALYMGIIFLVSILLSAIVGIVYKDVLLTTKFGKNILRLMIAYFISVITVAAYSWAMIRSNQMNDFVRMIIIGGSLLVMYSIYVSLEGMVKIKDTAKKK